MPDNKQNDACSDRRAFLRFGAMTAAVLGAAAPGLSQAAAKAAQTGPVRPAMIIDLDRCTGCGACVVACKTRNLTPTGQFLTRVQETVDDSKGQPRAEFIPLQCNQCGNAPCVAACPTGAAHTLANGVTVTDWTKCKSCGACLSACPYGARILDARQNKADQCDFCIREANQGVPPACVRNCPPRARLFGDLDAPSGEFGRVLAEGGLSVLKPELGLANRVMYKKRA